MLVCACISSRSYFTYRFMITACINTNTHAHTRNCECLCESVCVCVCVETHVRNGSHAKSQGVHDKSQTQPLNNGKNNKNQSNRLDFFIGLESYDSSLISWQEAARGGLGVAPQGQNPIVRNNITLTTNRKKLIENWPRRPLPRRRVRSPCRTLARSDSGSIPHPWSDGLQHRNENPPKEINRKQ